MIPGYIEVRGERAYLNPLEAATNDLASATRDMARIEEAVIRARGDVRAATESLTVARNSESAWSSPDARKALSGAQEQLKRAVGHREGLEMRLTGAIEAHAAAQAKLEQLRNAANLEAASAARARAEQRLAAAEEAVTARDHFTTRGEVRKARQALDEARGREAAARVRAHAA